ncbi:hypothetical protein pb186bvf_010312 [Paramecium bursaria]
MADDQQEESNYKFTPEGGQVGKSSRDYTGRGKALYANNEIYDGEYDNGIRQGKGVYIYANGDRYEGDFIKNLKHGIGKLVYKDKGEYYGQWENGQRHGEGIFTYVNKDVYSGWWAFGKKDGKGTYVYADTGARLVGDWKENKIVKGKWILPNGTFFEGIFENNKPNNQGTFYFKNGNTVTGNYKQTIIPNDDPDDKKLNIDMKWQSKGYLFQSAVLINSHENF